MVFYSRLAAEVPGIEDHRGIEGILESSDEEVLSSQVLRDVGLSGQAVAVMVGELPTCGRGCLHVDAPDLVESLRGLRVVASTTQKDDIERSPLGVDVREVPQYFVGQGRERCHELLVQREDAG